MRKTKARAVKIAAQLAELLKQSETDPAEKIRALLRAKKTAKTNWDRADRLEEQLLKEFGPELVIPMGKTKVAKFKNNFAEKNVAHRSHGIRQYELVIVEA